MGAMKTRLMELYEELAKAHDVIVAAHNGGWMPESVRADLYDAAWLVAHAAATVCMDPEHHDPCRDVACVENPDRCIRTRWVPAEPAHVRVGAEVTK